MRKGHVQKKDEQRRTDTTLALARALTYTYQELAELREVCRTLPACKKKQKELEAKYTTMIREDPLIFPNGYQKKED